jgi:hypothetical protein
MHTEFVAMRPLRRQDIVLGQFDSGPERSDPAHPAHQRQEKTGNRYLPVHIRDSIHKTQGHKAMLLARAVRLVYRRLLTDATVFDTPQGFRLKAVRDWGSCAKRIHLCLNPRS